MPVQQDLFGGRHAPRTGQAVAERDPRDDLCWRQMLAGAPTPLLHALPCAIATKRGARRRLRHTETAGSRRTFSVYGSTNRTRRAGAHGTRDWQDALELRLEEIVEVICAELHAR